MATYTLTWPGLPEIPFFVIDPKSNRLYSSEKPVPTDRLDLDVFENRYVKLSRILELFAPNMVPEVHFVLENLQKNFNAKPIVHMTEKHRRMTSYLPVELLLAMIVIWPLCASFQSTKKTLLNYLGHYSELVCMDCGYVHRDCKCDRLKTNPKNSFVGFATTSTEKGIQTDPFMNLMPGMNSMPATSTGLQPNNQGISVLLPSGVKLTASVKVPIGPTGGQIPPFYYPSPSGSLGTNMLDNNSNPFGFLKSPMGANLGQQAPPLLLPQPRSHKRGRPPVSPFPYLFQTSFGYQPNVACFNPFGSDGNPCNMSTPPSLMQVSGFQGLVPPDFSIPGCLPTTMGSNVNCMQPNAPYGINSAPPVTQITASSSLIGASSAGDGLPPLIGRKRKYSDGDLESSERSAMMRTIAVQTSTKSFIKKYKLKEEKLAEKSDVLGRGGMAGMITNEAHEKSEPGLMDSDKQSDPSHLTSRLPVVENLGASPEKLFPYADFSRRDDRDTSSKKFGGNLWRQLNDSSDDDDNDDDKPTEHTSNSCSGNKIQIVQNQKVDVKGREAVVNVPEKNFMKEFEGFLENNSDGNNDMLKAEEDMNDNVGGNLKEDFVHRGRQVEDVCQETGGAGFSLNHESSINKQSSFDALALGTAEKLDRPEKVPLSIVDVKDLDVDEDSRPAAASAIAGPNNLELLPLTIVENEDEVFKVLSDETGDDQKKDSTGDISKQDQQNASLAEQGTNEAKTDSAAIEDVPPVVELSDIRSSDTAGNSTALPSVRKIYGKFEYVPTREHIFRCLIPKCSQSFDTRLAAEMHNLVHPEGGDDVSHLKCPKCEFTAPFYHWFDLVRHVRQSHQMLMSREPFSCKLCGLVFETEEALTSHIDFHYSNRYKCIHCGLLLLTWGQVKRHLDGCVDKHKGNLNLGCPYCTFVFHKKNIRNLHLLSHSDVGLACALCQDNAAWADWKSLRKHYQNRHTKVLQGKIAPFRHKLPVKRKPPRCKRCDVEFKSHDLYVSHMTRTHDLVPYTLVECAICGHRFRTERSHEWHVKHVHVEEISCEKCDFVATSKSAMKTHFAQKHSDKQHTCSECEKSFAFYHQLKVHMAHHARHTIYPCQKCDKEFTRQNDLRQHLVNDHDDPSDKAPQSCPECEYRCYSRPNLNAHIKKLHPELLEDDNAIVGVASEDEEDGADHCYFTKKADAQPVIDLAKVRRFGRKKGRQRKTIKYEWDRMKTTGGSYLSIEDRRERRRMNRLMKEADDQMKRLKKLTCARTRSYNEHQAIKSGGKILNPFGRDGRTREQHSPQSQAGRPAGFGDSAGEFGAVETVESVLYSALPYLDHNYCKFENAITWVAGEKFRPIVPNRGPDEQVISAPDVSAFQECETQLLGLTSVPPVRRRGRPPNSALNRTVIDARRKFTSVLESVSSGVMQSSSYQTIRLMPRTVAQAAVATIESTSADDDGLENLSTEIPDFELITESDLLKNLGSYNIIDELFSMTQASGVSISTPDHVSKKVHLGDLPVASVSGFSFQSARESGEASESLVNTFSDGLVMDNEAQLSADFDDIELGEDVYSLFLGGAGNAQAGTGVQLENGSDDLNKGTAQNEVLHLASLPASMSCLTNSVSPGGLTSPKRIGNSNQRTVVQTLNGSSSTGAQPLTLGAISIGTEGPSTVDRHVVQRGASLDYVPPANVLRLSQPFDGSDLNKCTSEELFITKKAFNDTNSGSACDDRDALPLDKKASESLEAPQATSVGPLLSSNLSAEELSLPRGVQMQSEGSLEDERICKDIQIPQRPISESDTVFSKSPPTDPASTDDGSGTTVG